MCWFLRPNGWKPEGSLEPGNCIVAIDRVDVVDRVDIIIAVNTVNMVNNVIKLFYD